MAKLLDRVGVATSTTGTGTITLGSALADLGDGGSAQTFAAAGAANGDIVNYLIQDGTAWELGYGVYSTTGPTLTRVLRSSSTGALLNLSGAGVKVFNVPGTPDLVPPFVPLPVSSPYQVVGPAGIGSTATTSFAISNSFSFVPVFISAARTFTKIGLNVTTAGGTSLRLGIYSDKNGYPDALLLDAGTASTSSTGVKEITISQTLDKGLYWLACVNSGTGMAVTSTQIAATGLLTVAFSTIGNFLCYEYPGGSNANFPNPWNIAIASMNTASNRTPILWLRF